MSVSRAVDTTIEFLSRTTADLLSGTTEFLAGRTVLVAGAVAVVVLILVGLAVVRTLRRPPGVRFFRSLAAPDSISVLMHPNPDPDAMASALGVKRIAEAAGTDATIQFAGQIRHQENRAFRTVLDLDFSRIETAAGLVGDEVVLVDHNTPRGFTGAEGLEPYAVVDHHPGEGEGTSFTDVRPDYGACASILVEYLTDLDAEPVPPDEIRPDGGYADPLDISPIEATGLLYGVLSDTGRLTRGCSGAEFDACAFLYPGVDEELLDRIANPQVDAEILDVKARGIIERDVRGPFAVSDVGGISNVDAVPQAADELLSLEGITAVVVYGEHDGQIRLSGRSRDDRVHMGRTLREVTEDIPMASAGGHARMGGGQIPLNDEGAITADAITRQDLKERLFDAMTGDL